MFECLLLLSLADVDASPLPNGPLHEGFAEPVYLGGVNVEPVAEKPPKPVRERPSADKPFGRDVRWIDGYWDRADDRYVWVSGLWRDAPQRQSWRPGEWTRSAEGWVRTPGTWTTSGSETYIPKPPPSRERGPESDAPSADHFWVPGVWRYRAASRDFAWRAGYWQPGVEDFTWVPSRYRPTPRGYVFLGGYWDYLPVRRGAPHAAVVFPGGRPDGVFRPTAALNRSQIVAAAVSGRSGYSYRATLLPVPRPLGVSPYRNGDTASGFGLTLGQQIGVRRSEAITGQARTPFSVPRAGNSVQRYREYLRERPSRVRGTDRVRGGSRLGGD